MLRSFFLMLLVAFAAAPLVAQPPVRGGPQPFSPSPPKPIDRSVIERDFNFKLYTDPVIQGELKLTDDQKARIARIPDDLMAKHKDAIVREEAEVKEANDKAVAFAADATKAFDALLDRHLSAAQRKRFDQLAVQVRGVRAFLDTEVKKALGLTGPQLTKLGELKGAALEKLRAEFDVPLFVTGLGTVEERQKWGEASRKAAEEITSQFVATLGDKQKAKWAELTGDPCAAAVKASHGYPGPPDPPPGAIFTTGSPFDVRAAVLSVGSIRAELRLDEKETAALMAGWNTVLRTVAKDSGAATIAPKLSTRSKLGGLISDETSAACYATLTPAQATRVEQIYFRMARLSAFRSGYWVQKLHLTPAQVAKVEAVMAETSRKTQDLPPPATTADPARLQAGQAKRTQEAVELQQAALAEIAAIFDAGQARAWKELAGPPLDLSKLSVAPNNYFNSFAGNRREIVGGLIRAARESANAGEYAAALSQYDEALRLAPADIVARLGKAELLATCPSEWVRDGKQAVEIMTKLLAGTRTPSSEQYVILAAAHAEAGQFEEAVTAQEKALALLRTDNPSAAPKSTLEERLKLYREKKPYRMPEPKVSRPGGQ